MGSFFYTEKDRSTSLFLKENSRKEIIPTKKINILLLGIFELEISSGEYE